MAEPVHRRKNSKERPRTRSRPLRLTLDSASLTQRDLASALRAERIEVGLDPVSCGQMPRAREAGLEILESNSGMGVYGWNQAFGSFKDRWLEPEEQLRFQVDMLRSHGTGLGEKLPCRVSQPALIIRTSYLARGTSGIRPELVERMNDAVNLGLVPVMPGTGSMGAGNPRSMTAVGFTLTEDVAGRVRGDNGEECYVPRVWATMGRDVELQLAPGEAIALISGSMVPTTHLALAVEEVYRQVEILLGTFTLFCEAAWAGRNVFDPWIYAERHMPREMRANGLALRLINDSQRTTNEGRRRTDETAPRIQDSTSIRLVSHQIDIILRELERAREDVTREANPSICNPLLTPSYADESHEFLSDGNWDAMVLGHVTQLVSSCLARLVVLTKDLAAWLLYDGWSHELPAGLSGGEVKINSDVLLPYTSVAALVPEIQLLADPVGALSSPFKGGQEDFHTMAMTAVNDLRANNRRFGQLPAILFVIDGQDIHLLEERI